MGIFDIIDKLDNKYDKITGSISGIGSNYESKYNQYNTKINKYKSKYGSIYDKVMGAIDGFGEGISNSTSLYNETKAESISKINNSDTQFINTLDVINKNVARQNRFKLLMTLPSLNEISFFTDTSLLDTYVQGASLPSQSLNLTEVRYLNKEYTASLFITIDTININFYDTKELIIRNMFLGWQTAINPIDSLSLLNYFPDSYKTSFKIYIHETGYEVTDVIPITVGDFVFDHNSTNSLGTFSVTFKVKKVKPII
jgi:hypothetical protein